MQKLPLFWGREGGAFDGPDEKTKLTIILGKVETCVNNYQKGEEIVGNGKFRRRIFIFITNKQTGKKEVLYTGVLKILNRVLMG